ncbi:regulatory LuxR family protein [Haloactinopolyspora alba]|uniref:Regulatory LuxR family protein n=1 Tax=Haloactinopolyspora alba TaxID=648780 RepID=A0A2P8E8R2_9ACTN|nr:helix-turn-helix domain-containing protein [Haloactinopolyspora alba]PSL05865.1 regulatory LuxR family protein [Haloactinopolyspora alba]
MTGHERDLDTDDGAAGTEPGAATDGPLTLAPVGVSSFDEQVYRALLTRTDATPAGLAEQLGQPEARVDRAFGRLREHGLVTRMAGRRRRYTAVDPESAVEAMVRDRSSELDRVRGSALALSSMFHAVRRRAGGGGTVEMLNGPEELGRWFVRLQHQVRDEMLVLDRPPYALAATNPVEPVSLGHGVRWRAIYAPEALEVAGALDEVQALAARGEQGRVLPGLPLKLAIADRRIAVLPLDLDVEHAQAAVVRESTLLTALLELFELYWRQAQPIGVEAGTRTDDRQLAQLLATGLTDSAIARQLGLSTRTMRRRTRALYDELQATNRFQAGVQAARRGWL